MLLRTSATAGKITPRVRPSGRSRSDYCHIVTRYRYAILLPIMVIRRDHGLVKKHPFTAAVIGILMAAAMFFTLWVPLYAHVTPRVGDFPFFYFYLLIYMPATGIVLWIVSMLQGRLKR